MKDNGPGITFNVRITIAILVIAVGILFCALYFLFPSHGDDIKFVATIIGAGSAIYTAYYVGSSYRMGINRDKLRSTFAFTGELSKINKTSIRIFIEQELSEKELNSAQIYEKIHNTDGIEAQVTILLNSFEDISVAIQNAYVDERVAKLTLGFMIPFYFGKLKPYVAEVRKRLSNDQLYIETEKLVDYWKHNKLLSEGEVIT
jgi:Domain of unknown function (DUF4760)